MKNLLRYLNPFYFENRFLLWSSHGFYIAAAMLTALAGLLFLFAHPSIDNFFPHRNPIFNKDNLERRTPEKLKDIILSQEQTIISTQVVMAQLFKDLTFYIPIILLCFSMSFLTAAIHMRKAYLLIDNSKPKDAEGTTTR